MATNSKHPLWGKIGKGIANMIGLFLFQELVLRVLFPLPELKNFDRTAYLNLGDAPGRFTRNQSRI